MRKRRSRRRRAMPLFDISMTPLIDTALTLLVIFMIATPMIQNAIRVTLPKGKAKEDAGAQQKLVLYVDKEKNVHFNGAIVMKDELVTRLKQELEKQDDQMIHVKADQAVPYGTVLELVDYIKVVGGISYVVLATQKYAQAA